MCPGELTRVRACRWSLLVMEGLQDPSTPGLSASFPRDGGEHFPGGQGWGCPERRVGLSGGNGRSISAGCFSGGGCRAACWSSWHWPPSHTALTCLEAALASLPAARALPQLGIFPDIIWQLWEGESFSLRLSGCPRLSLLCLHSAGGWFGSGLVPQPGHLPIHDLAGGEVGIARHCHHGSRRMKCFHFGSSLWLS